MYVANNGSDQQVGGSISGFAMNSASGALTPLPGSPFAAGNGPTAIGSDAAGHFVFVAEDQSVPGARGSNCTDLQSMLLVKVVNPGTGVLSQTESRTLHGACARAVAVDPSGSQVYVAMARLSASQGEIQGFAISPAGTLTELPGSPFMVDGFPTGLAMHPSGRFLYAASDSGLLVIDRDTGTGALTERGAFNTPKVRLALNPAGTFLLASEMNSSEVSQFHVDPSTGDVAAIDFRPPASGPQGVAADPLGTYFAVTETLDPTTLAGGVSTFLLNSGTHEVDKTSGSPFAAGHGTLDVAFDPGGSFLYAVNRQDGNVSGFAVDRASGALTAVSGSPFAAGAFPDSLVVVKPH